MITSVIIGIAIILAINFFLTSKHQNLNTFFQGASHEGTAPGLWTLTFSQVTTWIFARSLLNSAILGFYYGIWGTLAYCAYYLSFLTGGAIIKSLRFEQQHGSIQLFLQHHFGPWGSRCYNLVIGLRLVSEVFANLLVIGIVFGVTGSKDYYLAIVIFAAATLSYSMLGGLQSSLRTDVFQMILLIIMLLFLLFSVITHDAFSFADLISTPFALSDPGPVLLLVALLQIWSYPMHDPVMMDRGFLADSATTRKSFFHASWISILFTLAFGILGIFAGVHRGDGASFMGTMEQLFNPFVMVLFNMVLAISAMSTLDSVLSSAAKFAVIDLWGKNITVNKGRLTMLCFMVSGVLVLLMGNDDLFSAVAVSGLASMYLVPVIFFSLWGKCQSIPLWSYLVSFVLAMSGAVLYFTESSGYTQLIATEFDITHKYSQLLLISVGIFCGGCLAFALGVLQQKRGLAASPFGITAE